MEQYILYLQIYLSITLFFLLLNSVIAGYRGETLNRQDISDSLFWPLSLAVLFGVLIRLLKESINTNKQTDKK